MDVRVGVVGVRGKVIGARATVRQLKFDIRVWGLYMSITQKRKTPCYVATEVGQTLGNVSDVLFVYFYHAFIQIYHAKGDTQSQASYTADMFPHFYNTTDESLRIEEG